MEAFHVVVDSQAISLEDTAASVNLITLQFSLNVCHLTLAGLISLCISCPLLCTFLISFMNLSNS